MPTTEDAQNLSSFAFAAHKRSQEFAGCSQAAPIAVLMFFAFLIVGPVVVPWLLNCSFLKCGE
jgi:hypothetical protein